MTDREVHAFGAFTLDASERRLTGDAGAVALAPKAFDVLLALVRRAGHLVSKRDLLDAVWGDAFVEEGVLAVHMTSLRKALGDDSRNPSYIETVSRSGYRFIAKLSAGATAAPAAAHSSETYELVGRGRFHLLSASRREVPLAIAAYTACVERDPGYAPAYAGLALAHCAQAEMRLAEPEAAYAAAKRHALRALAMDSGCADAQVALGVVLFFGEWDWTAAERAFRRALALNPQHTEAYLLCGRLLEAVGRLAEGLEVKLKALERDPFSPVVHVQIADSYWNQRRYDDVIVWANKTLALDAEHLVAREYVAAAHFKKADLDRYLEECVTHARAAGTEDEMQPLRDAYARDGRLEMVRALLGRVRRGEQAIPEMQQALLHGEVGELDEAFSHLDAALDSRDPCLVHLAVAPQWDDLRADPRFAERLVRMGLGS